VQEGLQMMCQTTQVLFNVETKSDPMDNLKAGELLSPVNGHSKPTAKQTLSAMIKEARLPQTEVGDDSDT
jgi:hypothetical protein